MFNHVFKEIRSWYNRPEDFIPLHEPVFIGNETKYVTDAIESTFVSSIGKYVNQFENEICKISGAKYAIATMNGTSALHISLLIAGVKRNSEVITQPTSFIATANAISYIGAKPVFIDIDKDTLALSPESLSRFFKQKTYINKFGKCINTSTGKEISACVPMHTFGFPMRIDKIVEICKKYNVPVIEDAAESLGSTYMEKQTGTFGLLGIYSFNGNKIVTAGGGGCIVTNDENLAKQAKHLTTTAKTPHSHEYSHDQIGYNYRLTNLSAALGCAQLEMLPSFIENKRKTAQNYLNYFSVREDFLMVEEIENSKSNNWLNTIILSDKHSRDSFLNEALKSGIGARPIWNLLYKNKPYMKAQVFENKHAEDLEFRIVNLPSSVKL